MNTDAYLAPSRAEKQRIKSLHTKKGRREAGAFLVEGRKSVAELLHSDWPIAMIYASLEVAEQLEPLVLARDVPMQIVASSVVVELSTLVNNQDAIAVAYEQQWAWRAVSADTLTLALDDIRDPGNLGTLLRLADWYGVQQVVCSANTAECYNPKVISASMGSFVRVPLHVVDLPAWLAQQSVPVLGAVLDGESTHALRAPLSGGVLVIGSESHGIRAEVLPLLTRRLTIPAFGQAESLNAAVAAGILLDTWRRG